MYDRWGYFAGRDPDRAANINAFFADDAIAGVVCYTGGWLLATRPAVSRLRAHRALGTPYELDTAGAILFLEDTHVSIWSMRYGSSK